MRGTRGSRPALGRLLPLLLFVVAVLIVALLVSGGALGATTTTLEPTVTSARGSATSSPPASRTQTATFRLSASDIGGFGGALPEIGSPSAIVETMDTGKVLFEHNAQKRRPMASTTKIMTAVLVLESGVDLDSTVKVSAKAAGTWEVSPWVKAGDVLTVKELMYALMLRSMNGAAVALAENDAGSVKAFAEKMNAKAEELGMKDTHFVNPNGLDAEGHYSTAADMAVLGRYAMKNEAFREFADTKQYTLAIKGHRALAMTNTNQLLQDYNWVTGIKTGGTPKGDYCLVASGTKNGRDVIAVVLGNPDSDGRFEDSAALLEYGLDQFRRVTAIEKGYPVAEASVPGVKDATLRLVTAGAIEADLSRDEVLTGKISVERRLELPVKAGDVYGYAVVTDADGDEVGKVDLVAAQSFSAQTLGSKLADLWHRLWD